MMFNMSRTPLSIRKPPPCLGEHNDYVFKDVIGMADDEIAGLTAKGTIGGDEYTTPSIFG